MTYSIIGSGKVGTALARHFARTGINVTIANTRGPDTLQSLAKELGEKVTPATLQEALKADIVIFAIPFLAHRQIAREATDWDGKIVVDAMNPYGVPVEELGGLASSDVVAAALPGAKIVKAFNQLPAALLASDPSQHEGRRVVFVSGNDDDASATVGRLAAQLGFAPILLGKVAEGGRLLQLTGPLLLQNLIKLS